MRREFLPTPISEDVLKRVLTAAHHAHSVGFMQPWDFIVVKNPETKAKIKAGFEQAHVESSAMFNADKAETYQNLKLEGVMPIRKAQFPKCMHGLLIAAARQARGDALPTMPMRWNHLR